MPGSSAYDWSKLKPRYMSGEFESIQQMATATGIPFGTLDSHSRRDGKGWYQERKALREKAEEEARRRIFNNIAQEAERGMVTWLGDATDLRQAAKTALKKLGKEMTITEALRALKIASAMEMEIFIGKGIKASTALAGTEEGDANAPRDQEELRAELHSKLARLAGAQEKGKRPIKA